MPLVGHTGVLMLGKTEARSRVVAVTTGAGGVGAEEPLKLSVALSVFNTSDELNE